MFSLHCCKAHLNVLGDNLLYEGSPTLHNVSVDKNGKSLVNNHFANMEGNLKRHFFANYDSKTPAI